MKINIKKIRKEQDDWINKETDKITEEQEDCFYSNVSQKMPLNIIPEITESIIHKHVDYKFFRKKEPNITSGSSPESLSDAYVSLLESCDISTDGDGENRKRTKWKIYYNSEYDFYFKTKEYFDDIMVEILTSIILKD